MSKSIYVMNTPTNCEECPLEMDIAGKIGANICRGREKYSFNPDSKKKPDWCPLKEVPQKKVMDMREELNMFFSRHVEGYNDCIDEILKECD